MGIKIDPKPSQSLPHRLIITLVCDGVHREPVGTQIETDSFPDAFKRFMSEGWLESRADGERSFLCPRCSGKQAMPAPRRTTTNGLPFTYSKLNMYVSCPLQYFETYIAKTVPYVETAARQWGNAVDDALTKRIRAKAPLPPTMAKWEKWAAPFDNKTAHVQLELGVRENGTACGYWDEDVFGRTKIDLIYKPGDYTARIFDWKTGKVREDPWQLRVEGLIVQANDPALRALAGWYVWLADGPAGSLGQQHDLSDVERTWAEVTTIVNDINKSAQQGYWPAQRNGLCKAHCDVYICAHNGRKPQ